MAYDFELHVSGICLFEFDQDPPTRCTIYIPSALFPDGVQVFQSLQENMPYPHHPSLSFPVRFLAKKGTGRPRQPDEIRPAADADELAIYYLEGDDLTLGARGASPLQVNRTPGDPHNFDQTADVDEYLAGSGVAGTFDPERAITRLTFAIGDLETHALGQIKGQELTYRVQDIAGTVSLPDRQLAEVEVLRLRGLESPVVFTSPNPLRPYIALAAETADDDVVRASLTNLHRTVLPNRPAIFDFFWYYGLYQLTPTPSMKKLLIPWLPDQLGGGARTGSSGECPPTRRMVASTGTTKTAALAAPPGLLEVLAERVDAARQAVTQDLAGAALVEDFLRRSRLELSPKARLRHLADLERPVRELAQVQDLQAFFNSIGGTLMSAANDSAPECVALGSSLQGASGVLVLPDVVLTAGHVIDVVDWQRVGFGVDASSPIATRNGVDYQIHPDYEDKPNLLNDLAVILLDKPVADVALPSLAGTALIDAAPKLLIVGFGATATVPRGKKNYIEPKKLATSANGFIFAGEVGLDSCTGDSGGPAYVREASGARFLAALVSHAYPILSGPASPCGSGGAYQRLDVHRAWINQAVQDLRTAAGRPAGPLL